MTATTLAAVTPFEVVLFGEAFVALGGEVVVAVVIGT